MCPVVRLSGTARDVDALQAAVWALPGEGRYAEARVRALDRLDRVDRRDALSRAAASSAVGRAHSDLGDHTSAATFYGQLPALHGGRTTGQEAERLRVRGRGLADCRRLQGRYREVESAYLRAKAVAEERPALDDPVLPTLLDDLGIVHNCTGRFTDAEPRY